MPEELRPAKDADNLTPYFDKYAVGPTRDGEIFYVHVDSLSPLSITLIVAVAVVFAIFMGFYIFPVFRKRRSGISAPTSKRISAFSWSPRLHRGAMVPSQVSPTTSQPSSRPPVGLGIRPSHAHVSESTSPVSTIFNLSPSSGLCSKDSGDKLAEYSNPSIVIIPADASAERVTPRSSPRKHGSRGDDIEAQRASD